MDWKNLQTELSIILVISDNMRAEQDKQPLYLKPTNLISLHKSKEEGQRSHSHSPIHYSVEEPLRSDEGFASHQKLSADDQAEENSKELFNQFTVDELYLAQTRQNQFMESLQHLRDGIIQHQVLSHISHQGQKYQRLNYTMIREFTKSRIDKMVKNRKIKKNWSNQDLKILVWIVAKYCEKKKIKDVYIGIEEHDWKFISLIIPGTTSQMCMFKWLSLRKSKVRDQRWQKRQQALLEQLVLQYGQKNWGQISKQLFYQNDQNNKVYRCGKQCREHWNCFLNPSIKKGNWTQQQDQMLVQLVLQARGKKHWAKMVGKFGGRTQNALKNRYSIIIDREQSQESKKMSEMEILEKLIKKKHTPIKQEKQSEYQQRQQSESIRQKQFEIMRNIKHEQMIPEEIEGMEDKGNQDKQQHRLTLINPSNVVYMDDDRLEELRKKSSHLFYALQKNQTYHLASSHNSKKFDQKQEP